LRIGYLSSDFRRHVMGDLMLRVLRCHDRSRFEINAYSLLPRALEDAYSVQFQSRCNRYVRLAELDDSAAAERIADDGLDLLVDLTGHTPQARPAILLRKPAPVIVGHLGDHGTVGVEQVDFKLTDAVADLPDAAEYQVEKPLAMEGCVMPFRRVTPSPPDPDARARLGIPMSAVVLGAFTSVLKLSPRCVELWRRILENVPSARLALSTVHPDQPRSIDRAAHGGRYSRRSDGRRPAERRRRDQPRALSAHRRAARHVALYRRDSTVAALDMGVPVVTRAASARRNGWGSASSRISG
jgi:predicted O-linked N-acetylglucosamine transferase (SPINDLY family)